MDGADRAQRCERPVRTDALGAIHFPGTTLPSAQFERNVRRAMTGLVALGARAGDSVILLLRNDPAFLEAAHATSRLGASPVPVNWHTTPAEVATIIEDSGARIAVVHDDLAAAHAAVWPAGMALIGVDAGGAPPHPGATRWRDLVAGGTEHPGARVSPRGALIYTSGTTSAPKAIDREALTGPQSTAMVETQRATYGFRAGMRALICGPLYHAMSMSYANTALTIMGEDGDLFIESKFDAQRMLELVQQHRITHLLMVPVMFVRLLRLDEAVRRRYDVSSIEWVIHAAAPCAPDVKLAMMRWWGPVLNEFYGSSETGPVTLIRGPDYFGKPGSVGRPLPGCRVEVLDDAGRALPPGTPGEIAVRNANYPEFTYRHRPEERAKLDRGGLIASGDVGLMDEDGYLFLLDRKKDMVISGGVNIYPSEIEGVLLGNEAIRDCAVFGIPDAEFGEAMAAHVEVAADHTVAADDLRAWLLARLPSYKVPKVIRFEPLPRDDNGKIAKRRIADAYWEGAGRRI